MKGQWFIISAVIASTAFLGLSFLLKDYFVVDSSSPAKVSNDFYFNNIAQQLDNIIANTPPGTGNCINLTTNLGEFKSISERSLGAKGLFFYMNYTIRDCALKKVDFNFIIATKDQVIYNFTTARSPGEVIG